MVWCLWTSMSFCLTEIVWKFNAIRKKFSIIQALIVFITTFVLYYLADYIEYNIYNLSNILSITIYACSATIICWLVNSRWSECSDTCIGQECGCHESYDLIVRIARRYYVIIQKQPKEVYILTNNRQRLSIAWKLKLQNIDCKI